MLAAPSLQTCWVVVLLVVCVVRRNVLVHDMGAEKAPLGVGVFAAGETNVVVCSGLTAGHPPTHAVAVCVCCVYIAVGGSLATCPAAQADWTALIDELLCCRWQTGCVSAFRGLPCSTQGMPVEQQTLPQLHEQPLRC